MCQQAMYLHPRSSPRRVRERRAGWRVKSIPICALLLYLASWANAQVLFDEIQKLSLDVSGRKTPVIADITVRTTSITPWGTYVQSLKGKFWRSRDGKNRQDDSFGTSFLLSTKFEVWVDREQRTVVLEPWNRPLVQSPLSWFGGAGPGSGSAFLADGQ